MPFQNDIVGGTKLLIPAIQSPNYVPGAAGWRIARDGTAEFSNITSRGPVSVIQPGTGQVLASIGATGNIAGQVGTFNDVIVNGTSLDTLLAGQGRGIIGYWDIGASALPAPGNGVFTNLAWVRCNWDANRVVRVTARQIGIQTTSINFQLLTSQWIYSNNLVTPVTFGSNVQEIPSTSGVGLTPSIFAPVAYFADSRPASTGGRATFLLQTKATAAGCTYNNGGWGLVVEDIGPLSAVTTFRDGGTGTPSGLSMHTVTYPSLLSGAFDGNGNNQGLSDRGYTGNIAGSPGPSPQRFMWTFDGAGIRATLAGGTLNSATLWQYCTGSSGSDGEMASGWLTNTTIPGTYPGPGTNFADYSGWPVPGWHSVDVTSAVGTNVLAGINANAVMQTLDLFQPSCAWAGVSSAFPPYLVIQYTI